MTRDKSRGIQKIRMQKIGKQYGADIEVPGDLSYKEALEWIEKDFIDEHGHKPNRYKYNRVKK